VQVIRHHFLDRYLPAALGGDLLQQLARLAGDPPAPNPEPIRRAPHRVQAQ